MDKSLTKVEFESISGIPVVLDAETVINYCARGNGEITPQEVALFLRTCQAKRLDPLENGEVYLIKYDNSKPAQIVVGKHAYNRRADRHPEYRGKKSGIVVVRGDQVVQKEGCCLYDVLGEKLIGGWCRVYRFRSGSDTVEEFYREVSLAEYSSGQANWKVKPATMIEKVAVSQCLREAFPNEYEGLYSEDEMIASGAIPGEITPIGEDAPETSGDGGEEEQLASYQQRQHLFSEAKKYFGKGSNDVVKEILTKLEIESTAVMTVSQYGKALLLLDESVKEAFGSNPPGNGESNGVAPAAVENAVEQ